ncbi:MAG: hypothetical protein KatS3mg113_0516 [Planctomycetaceae bacterium]|nr:MAG: hypothetical protein KatS3mg113_0516 [Planctomycetaceae bacterium]
MRAPWTNGLMLLLALILASYARQVWCDEAPPEHAAAHHSDHAGGPDLPMNWQADLALWSAVTFLVFLFVLSKLAWKPLSQALADREHRIRHHLKEAEDRQRKAEDLLRDYQARLAKVQDEVKEILAEARRDAEHTRQEILTTAQREADTLRQRALNEIRLAKESALHELFTFVSQQVLLTTEKLLGRQLSAEDQDRLVRETLQQLPPTTHN